jgi:hypothetical protein
MVLYFSTYDAWLAVGTDHWRHRPRRMPANQADILAANP